MPRFACKKDMNHDEIARAFLSIGWDVIDTYQVGQLVPGFPDLIVTRGASYETCEMVVGCHPVVLGIEVKGPGGRLTPDERMFAAGHPDWVPVVVRTVDDVLELSGMAEEG